ncbi:hypothetical protein [Indiicoccus explosivorum]|uniref:hypothetical protein n=1 Tax=Indiicoccus explosivorum TaxID=1917864 RepID=UPI0013DE0A28|nr:hypothetical protein [Indiicoccus explosivorum]
MDLFIKLFGENKEESCCAVEIKEVKRNDTDCCPPPERSEEEKAAGERQCC